MSEIKNTISIFKNEDKKSEKSPDYSGNIEIKGEKFRVALWVKQAKNGKAYLGGLVSEDTPKQQPTEGVKKEYVSDLPF
jgi:uncharacterized protein (DUF736 family)